MYRKIWRIGERTFEGMIGEYGPWIKMTANSLKNGWSIWTKRLSLSKTKREGSGSGKAPFLRQLENGMCDEFIHLLSFR